MYAEIIFCCAVVFGFLMSCGIGANDVANSMGTVVGSKVIPVMQAMVLAAIFETLGACLGSNSVINTIRSDLVNISYFSQHIDFFLAGMLASLMASAVWLFIASYHGWPVSTTHTIIGAVIGFNIVSVGWSGLHWQLLFKILATWVVTPLFAAVVSFLLFKLVQVTIFSRQKPLRSARKVMPFLMVMVFAVILLTIIWQSQMVFQYSLTAWSEGLVILLMMVPLYGVSRYYYQQRQPVLVDDKFAYKRYVEVEQMFTSLVLATACTMSFSHGANDIANAIGPIVAINTVLHGGDLTTDVGTVPFWILALGSCGVVIGLLTYGRRVMHTIGENITTLTPSAGFCAQLATAMVVIIATNLGMPVSTTQTLVGAVLGVGFARGVGALNITVVRNIFSSWVVTLPAGGILSIIFYKGMLLALSLFSGSPI